MKKKNYEQFDLFPIAQSRQKHNHIDKTDKYKTHIRKKYNKSDDFYKKKPTNFYRKKSPYKKNNFQNSLKRKCFYHGKYSHFFEDFTKKSSKSQNKLNQ